MSEIGACDIPVHCVIESINDGACLKCTTGGEASRCRKLLDAYAIVTGRTPLCKLTDAVLVALGFPQYASPSTPSVSLPLQNNPNKAKGLIVIDNWKPLTFDQITDDQETPIEHLFKHLGGNRWLLKILVDSTSSPSPSGGLSLVIPNETASAIGGTSPDDSVKGVDQAAIAGAESTRLTWQNLVSRYHPYFSNYGAHAPKLEPISAPSIAAFMANRLLIPTTDIMTTRAPSTQTSPSSRLMETGGERGRQLYPQFQRRDSNESNNSDSPKRKPAHQQRGSVLVSLRTANGGNLNSRSNPEPTTCRLMFDPLTELPLLNEWFDKNSHPTCHDIEKYTEVLNSKPYRLTYPSVSTHNVKIWFKNRRAKCKRT